MSPNDMAERSSRDPLADARFARGQAALIEGALDEAADMIEQALALAPDWVGAWHVLGTIQQSRGLETQARHAHTMALRLDPLDRHGASLALARLGDTLPPAAAPEAYVTTLFDGYASRFEDHLITKLAYRGPRDLLAALAAADVHNFGRVLDLGCGTGLCGAVLRSKADHLTGVDLSSRMVVGARAKAIYDRLEVGALHAFLSEEADSSADLVVAGDVLIYIGDLAPLFKQVACVLRPGGAFAFSTQHGATEPYAIGADMRFHHAKAYVLDALLAASFADVRCDERSVRREKGTDVPGLIVVCRRHA